MSSPDALDLLTDRNKEARRGRRGGQSLVFVSAAGTIFSYNSIASTPTFGPGITRSGPALGQPTDG
ncbi:hypothetical protein ACRALDRAFT_2016681 [Sodiomyces alcalophilus JCM 7366]|uniref:uncharacterized protein n=1 Tax=Sodiomyces alcalophilus JCM 7366 TaxID=591952 RepID=UPI0039B56096